MCSKVMKYGSQAHEYLLSLASCSRKCLEEERTRDGVDLADIMLMSLGRKMQPSLNKRQFLHSRWKMRSEP